MGEAPKLTAQESGDFVERVLRRVGGKVPVIVGASAPGFAAMKALSQRVVDMGADGVMVAPAAGLSHPAGGVLVTSCPATHNCAWPRDFYCHKIAELLCSARTSLL